MPDRDDPVSGDAEWFAEAVEPARRMGARTPVRADALRARDLEIVALLRALGSAGAADSSADCPAAPRADGVPARLGTTAEGGDLSATRMWVEAKARVRARVLATLAEPPSDGREAAPTPRHATSDGTPTEALPVLSSSTFAGSPAEQTAVLPRAVPGPTVSRTAGSPTGLRAAALRTAAVRTAALRTAISRRPAGRQGAVPRSATRRITIVGAATLLSAIVVAASAVLASRNAVPGDPLYGVKRAAEAAGGLLATSDGPRGRRDLHLAATRLDEIERMAHDADPALLRSALHDLDAAAVSGSRLALTNGGDPDGTQNSVDLAAWAAEQTVRLSTLRATLPRSAQLDVDDALRLLDRVHRRAVALAARSGCASVTSGAVDDLGPLPTDAPCGARPSSPTPPTVTPPDPAAADPADGPPGSAPADGPAAGPETTAAAPGADTTAPAPSRSTGAPGSGAGTSTAPDTTQDPAGPVGNGGKPAPGDPAGDDPPGDDAGGRGAVGNGTADDGTAGGTGNGGAGSGRADGGTGGGTANDIAGEDGTRGDGAGPPTTEAPPGREGSGRLPPPFPLSAGSDQHGGSPLPELAQGVCGHRGGTQDPAPGGGGACGAL